MIFISHRGNINGPNKVMENKIEYINKALKLGYHVEIDVWLIKNKYYLGHDEPLYEVDLGFLKNNKLYCHAKNLDALENFLKFKDTINFFSHDKENYVLTSNNKIWAYPGYDLSNNCIACMPEKALKFPIKCFGICTDYPENYKKIFKYKEEFDKIYHDMRNKNIDKIKNIGLLIDYDLNKKNDNRKCFGISTKLNTSDLNINFKNMKEEIDIQFNNQIIYDNINSGLIHFSFINLISFDDFEINQTYIDENYNNYKNLFDEIFEPFTIFWEGLIALPTGLCMIGFPNINLNNIREIYRKKLNENNLKINERYKSDIVHSTIIRLSNNEDKNKILSIAKKYKNTYFGFTHINSMNLLKGTWKALENNVNYK